MVRACLIPTLLVAVAGTASASDLPVIATASGLPMQMEIAGGDLYVRASTSSLERVSLDDGDRETLVASGAGAFAISGDELFYATQDGLWKLALDGGEPTRLATTRAQPIDLALDATDVYFTTYALDAVYRVDRDGGEAERVFAKRGAGTLAVDATFVYVGNWRAGTVSRVHKRKGWVEVLARKQKPAFLLADAERVYWSAEVGGTVSLRALRKPGPKRLRKLPKVQVLATDMGLNIIHPHGDHLYYQGFAGDGVRSIARVRRGGGEVELLADALPYPGSLAIDGRRVYVGLEGKIVELDR